MDPCKEALLSHLVKLCVRNRADGQRLCPNFDNICVRQRRKSLYFNERRDNIYVPHHLGLLKLRHKIRANLRQ